MTQEKFGATIGLTRGRVCQLERIDGQGLALRNLRRLLSVHRLELRRLGLTAQDFLELEGSREPTPTEAGSERTAND